MSAALIDAVFDRYDAALDQELPEQRRCLRGGQSGAACGLLQTGIQVEDAVQEGERQGWRITFAMLRVISLREGGAGQDVVDRAVADLHGLGYVPFERGEGVAEVGAAGHVVSPQSVGSTPKVGEGVAAPGGVPGVARIEDGADQ